jgi:hypothetical protein
MVISFDLDDTLIPGVKRFETESQSLFQRVLGIEKIRTGTVQLIKDLQDRGHTVFVYTTSFRKPRKIRFMFRTYGIKLDKIINQTMHDRTLGRDCKRYSKYPPAFGIDIHIDDSKGVEMEGMRFNFRTIIVSEDQNNWESYIFRSIGL